MTTETPIVPDEEFREFIRERAASLHRTAYLLCGDWHLADDLVQEALAKAFRHWRRVRRTDSPNAYVHRILINEAKNYWRRQRDSERQSVFAAWEITSPCPGRMSDHGERAPVSEPSGIEPSGIETAASVPRPIPLRRNQGFRMLWTGQLLSDTGTQIGGLAYPLLILALTHSAVLAGVVGTARAVTALCLQLPAGALSDRFDRRLTMIICDILRAGLLAVLAALIVAHLASWPVVLVVSVIEGGASTIFNPAATAALPGIVPDGQLEEAWAATEARTSGAGLAGPALGGILFGLGRAVPFLADALSYAVSFGTVSRIRGRFRPENAAGRKALWREVTDGLQFVWQVPILRAAVIQIPLANFAFSGVLFAITLALRKHGTSTVVIGLVQAAIAVGGLLGAVVAPRLQGRMRLATLATTITLTGALLFGAAALLVPSPLVAAPVALALLLAPAANAALVAVVLRSAPEDMRGRVTSTVVMAATALAALAPLVAGLLVQHVSGAWALGAFAAAMAMAAALCLILPGLRQAESGGPSSDP
jgi:MFS family permease